MVVGPGKSGSTKHLFQNCGVIRIDKDKLKEEEIFDIAINAELRIALRLHKFMKS